MAKTIGTTPKFWKEHPEAKKCAEDAKALQKKKEAEAKAEKKEASE